MALTPAQLLDEAIKVGCEIDIIENGELMMRGPPKWIAKHRQALLRHKLELRVIVKSRAARAVEYGKILPFRRK